MVVCREGGGYLTALLHGATKAQWGAGATSREGRLAGGGDGEGGAAEVVERALLGPIAHAAAE